MSVRTSHDRHSTGREVGAVRPPVPIVLIGTTGDEDRLLPISPRRAVGVRCRA